MATFFGGEQFLGSNGSGGITTVSSTLIYTVPGSRYARVSLFLRTGGTNPLLVSINSVDAFTIATNTSLSANFHLHAGDEITLDDGPGGGTRYHVVSQEFQSV